MRDTVDLFLVISGEHADGVGFRDHEKYADYTDGSEIHRQAVVRFRAEWRAVEVRKNGKLILNQGERIPVR